MPGFASGGYESKSRVMAGERCINLFPEAVAQGGKVRSALLSIPGVTTFATLTAVGGRGIFEHDGRCFTVYGNTLFELDSNGVPTNRGTVAVNGNPAQFDTNGDAGGELMVASGDQAYILTLSTNVLTNPLTSGAAFAGQVDGFLVTLNTATSTLRASDSLDGQTWNGLMVAQRTSASDPWQAMAVVNGEIALMGNKTGELWYNAGLPTFPFARRPEGTFQVGIAANYSLCRFNGSIAWLGLGEDGRLRVYFLDGYTPTPISKPGLDWLIQEYQTAVGVEDAVAWSYAREGHEFYVLSFPTSKRTHVYDATTDQWHERGFWDSAAGDYAAYRSCYVAHCFNKHLVCDPESNIVYQLSSTTHTDVGGEELRRARRTPHLSDENKKLYFPLVELECDRGVGNTNDPGSDPLVNLRYSNDGGHTWGASRSRHIGKKGEYDNRVRWEMCGSGRDRVWEVWQSDPVAANWFDLYVTVAAGVH